MTLYQAELKQRQGRWCRRFWDAGEALAWAAARAEAQRGTVNPVQVYDVVEVPERTVERWGTERALDVPCPAEGCGQPVAASVGVHFDCRG